MDIYQRIKELRKEKGISQTELAKAINHSQSTITDWENRKKRPTADAIIALAKFFDVTTDYLLGLSDN